MTMIMLGRRTAAKNVADMVDHSIVSGAQFMDDSELRCWFL